MYHVFLPTMLGIWLDGTNQGHSSCWISTYPYVSNMFTLLCVLFRFRLDESKFEM